MNGNTYNSINKSQLLIEMLTVGNTLQTFFFFFCFLVRFVINQTDDYLINK